MTCERCRKASASFWCPECVKALVKLQGEIDQVGNFDFQENRPDGSASYSRNKIGIHSQKKFR